MQPRRQSDADGRSDSLESRLRNLPPLPVPGDLEARLLAAIPAEKICTIPHLARVSGRRRTLWAGAGIAFAAACILMVIIWPKSAEQGTDQGVAVTSDTSESARQSDNERQVEVLNIVTRLEDR